MQTVKTRVHPRSYINGEWLAVDGDSIVSRDPAQPDRVIWSGSPDPAHANVAVQAAREALPAWAALSLDQRAGYLKRWKEVAARRAEDLAGLITDEMGKTLAESTFEARVLGSKVDITLDEVSLGRVREYEVAVSQSRTGFCRFKPHGVMAVIAPFNFPAHLANGHFVPALLMGNTIVLKPSEKTPGVGQMLAEMMDEVGLPAGLLARLMPGTQIALIESGNARCVP